MLRLRVAGNDVTGVTFVPARKAWFMMNYVAAVVYGVLLIVVIVFGADVYQWWLLQRKLRRERAK